MLTFLPAVILGAFLALLAALAVFLIRTDRP